MRIEPLAVPGGAAVATVLPRLARALEGGHPIAPYAAGSPPPQLPPHDVAGLPRDLGVVVGTSGSTGQPKRAMLGAGSLHASINATHTRLSGPGQWLLTMPAHHIAGLQVLLRSLVAGTTPHVMDLGGGFTPSAWTTAVDAMPATDRPTYVSLVPTQLTRLLADAGATQRLTTFAAVLVGGAATHPDLLARAAEAGVTAVTTYGMSETAGGCVYDGEPLDDTTVLVDHDGRIHLGGATLAHGYLGDPALTATAFPSFGTRLGRVFRTDDVGHVDDNGRLHVDGRMDDLVNTGGLKVAPRIVEEAVARLPGIAEAVAVGIPDPEWGQAIAVAVRRGAGSAPSHPLTVGELREQLRGILPDHALPRALLEIEDLPTRGPGKPDRAAVIALFAGVGE
ncbi:o-succinylbenzoate--CoA ligase [Knoellia sp. Soil729]|uniref:o-succinylbenzoate--CoA ligase n=1 Tax=Knoellia sp. Soil729 TaxID=1736394 RepID=UPI0006F79D4C|nr:o-succinylbenzoate--CoA ligase [Knoellia sp. Soil729]KRE42351.1 AMP-dependent synthetase [Knoellia sp. Soil729]